jgi:hypothetical protein
MSRGPSGYHLRGSLRAPPSLPPCSSSGPRVVVRNGSSVGGGESTVYVRVQGADLLFFALSRCVSLSITFRGVAAMCMCH